MVVPGLTAATWLPSTSRHRSIRRREFPEGVNVEVVTAPEKDGAGVVTCVCTNAGWGRPVRAARARWRRPSPRCATGRDTGAVAVRVPGGEVRVTVADNASFLSGPSVLVARGEIADDGWAHRREIRSLHPTRHDTSVIAQTEFSDATHVTIATDGR